MNSFQPLSQIRAEAKGEEAWKDFVIPPAEGRPIEMIRKANQTRIIVGGRGSGKTMLLSYLSTKSEYSSDKVFDQKHTVDHVGVKLRVDGTYLSQLQGYNKPEEVWRAVFEAFFITDVAVAMLEAVFDIARSSFGKLAIEDLETTELIDLPRVLRGGKNTLVDVLNRVLEVQEELENYESNLFDDNFRPLLIKFKTIRRLSFSVRNSFKSLIGATFNVYVDEYESLLQYQRSVLNTFIKYSEPPLVFHFAMRPKVIDHCTDTLTNQRLQKVHDYEVLVIEKNFRSSDIDVFHWEIILSELAKVDSSINLDKKVLTNPEKINYRRSKDYADKIIRSVKKIFPSLGYKEIASIALGDNAISKKIEERIDYHISKRHLKIDKSVFLNREDARESVIAPVLLSRKRYDNGEIVDFYTGNSESKISDLVSNNFVAAILHFYDKYQDKSCPIYSGYDRLEMMSNLNIRFLMQICHNALAYENDLEINSNPISCSTSSMVLASYETSKAFLEELKASSEFGNRIFEVTLRIGKMFAQIQRDEKLSENEINHFIVQDGMPQLTDEEAYFVSLMERCQSIDRRPQDKLKGRVASRDFNWYLNPNFAPYFGISFRVKRSLQLSQSQFMSLFFGDDKSWKIQSQSLVKPTDDQYRQVGLPL